MGHMISRALYGEESLLEDEVSAMEKGTLRGNTNTDKNQYKCSVMIYVHKNGIGYKGHNANSTQGFAWNDLLEEFATNLLPDPEYYQRGIIIANQVFSMIKYFRQDVARVKIGGSVGKHTGISTNLIHIGKNRKHVNPEFDLYIFLDIQEPDFVNINTEFRNNINILCRVLPKFSWLGDIEENNDDSKIFGGIHFKVDGKIFHLYPAINFVETKQKEGYPTLHPLIQTLITESKHFVEVQRVKTLNEMQKCESTLRNLYIPSLEESSVRFYKNRSRLVRQAIRLVKYWNLNLDLLAADKSSNSLLMDLCTMKAVADCETRNLYDIICKFMELLIDFPNLKIAFQLVEDDFVEYQEFIIADNSIFITLNILSYDPTVTGKSVDETATAICFTKHTLRYSLPCILDPCNPSNNLGDLGLHFWNEIKTKAATTLSRLKNECNRSEELIQHIFEK